MSKTLLIFYIGVLISYSKIHAQPVFKGGEKRLSSFITSRIIYPDYAKKNCLEGVVHIRFKLNSKGNIFESAVDEGMGIDLDDEALRIIRLSSGKWFVPAEHDSTIALIIPIHFSLKGYNCEKKSSDDIKEAIKAYKTEQDLTRVIFNYYDKNISDKSSGSEEIERIKAQLGYNEKFIAKKIKTGQKKLRQGDLQGACEDFNFVRKIGSNQADGLITHYCY